jgi:hypothetical protein
MFIAPVPTPKLDDHPQLAVQDCMFKLLRPTGYVTHQQFNTQQLYELPHSVYVFCIYVRTNSDFSIYIKIWLVFITEMKSDYNAVRTGSWTKAVCACANYSIKWLVFINRDEKCLQRGTDWVFK